MTIKTINESEWALTNKIEKGYSIWPIGNNIQEGYLPIAKFENFQMVEGTLKLIKCEKAQLILKATIKGFGTVKKINRRLKKAINDNEIKFLNEVKEELIKLEN